MPKPRHGLARELSKRGYCSRSEAWRLIQHGRVEVNARVCRHPEHAVDPIRDRITVDGQPVTAAPKAYFLFNKPRGLVTTSEDEQGRRTIFDHLRGFRLPRLIAVGRLDKASEGLLLLTNDTAWAAAVTDPRHRVQKIYHVQIDGMADAALCAALKQGAKEGPDWLAAEDAVVLRSGIKTAWLEITLEEGKNRHLRRLLGALGREVRRLVRIRIGSIALGSTAKGAVRPLLREEIESLAPTFSKGFAQNIAAEPRENRAPGD